MYAASAASAAASAASAATGSTGSKTGDEKEWDALFIGAFADHVGHKRPWMIGELNASRVFDSGGDSDSGSSREEGPHGSQGRRFRRGAIGKQDGEKAAAVAEGLRAKGVEVLAPVPYAELAALIRASRSVYVPDDVLGGGERAVLEARSLGVRVIIEESDNPKLAELLTSPIYDHAYYAKQLSYGLDLLAFRAYAEQQQEQRRRRRR